MISIKTQRKLLSLAVATALGSFLAAPVLAQDAAPPAEEPRWVSVMSSRRAALRASS